MSAASTPSSPSPLTRATRIVATSDQVSAELQGETVILSMADGVYYGLDRVGSRIWGAVTSPVSLQDVLDRILDEFEVGEERAWDDLQRLVSELLAHRLVVRLPD